MTQSIPPGPEKLSKSRDWCQGIARILEIGHNEEKKAKFIVEFANMMKTRHRLDNESLEILREMYRKSLKILSEKKIEVKIEKPKETYDEITTIALEVFPGSEVIKYNEPIED